MSRMSWPNRITIGRILLIAPFVICLMNLGEWPGARWVAVVMFFAMAAGDALDGYLARRRNETTPLGQFLDPLADKLLIVCAVILMALPVEGADMIALPSWVAVVAIGKDLVVVIGFGVVYLAVGRVWICPRRLGKLCTTSQLVLVIALLLSPELRLVSAAATQWGARGLWWLATGLAVAAALDYVHVGSRFMRESAAASATHDG